MYSSPPVSVSGPFLYQPQILETVDKREPIKESEGRREEDVSVHILCELGCSSGNRK